MRIPGWALVAALAVAAAAVGASSRTQWDLKVYLQCARTQASGENPYARDAIVHGVTFPCLYPPAAIDGYRPFAALNDAFPGLGSWLWLALKVAAFAGLLALWRRWPEARLEHPLSALFLALGYGTALWVDLRSGNAAMFEMLLLWSAFAAFAAGSDILCVLLVAVAAQAKILPLFFLVLPLLKPRPNWGAPVAGALAAGALALLGELAHPGGTAEFLELLRNPAQGWHYEKGPNNTSPLAFVQHLFEVGFGDRGRAVPLARSLWWAWAACVGAAAWRAARRVHGAGLEPLAERRRLVALACLAYALVAPRFKDYSYILLLVPTLVVLWELPPAWAAAIAAASVLNAAQGLGAKLGLGRWAFALSYFKLFAALGAFGAFLRPAQRTTVSQR
jgi:hypothetical protein